MNKYITKEELIFWCFCVLVLAAVAIFVFATHQTWPSESSNKVVIQVTPITDSCNIKINGVDSGVYKKSQPIIVELLRGTPVTLKIDKNGQVFWEKKIRIKDNFSIFISFDGKEVQ